MDLRRFHLGRGIDMCSHGAASKARSLLTFGELRTRRASKARRGAVSLGPVWTLCLLHP